MTNLEQVDQLIASEPQLQALLAGRGTSDGRIQMLQLRLAARQVDLLEAQNTMLRATLLRKSS